MGVVIPLASRIHGSHYYRQLLKPLEDFFRSRDFKVFDVLDSEELIADDVLNAVRSSTPILLVLTGGTSRLAWKLLSGGSVRSALIVTHGEHNSLPSAISIKNRADAEGIPTRIYFCENLTSNCGGVLEDVVKLCRTVNQLYGLRVAVISDSEEEYRELFEGVTGMRTSLISYGELEKLLNEVGSGVGVDELGELRTKLEDVSQVDEATFKDSTKIYLALKKLVSENGFDAVAIDCFPYLIKYRITPCLAVSLLNDKGIPTACEGDLRSLLLMILAKALGGWPAWIANTSSVIGSRLVLAHCTVATKLAYRCGLITHFESNLPYSLSCRLPPGTFTLAGIDREFTTLATLKVKLIDSGSLFDGMCRTQAVVESEVDLRQFPNVAVSNHHVLMPGDLNPVLKDVAYMLGLDFMTYESVIKYLSGGL